MNPLPRESSDSIARKHADMHLATATGPRTVFQIDEDVDGSDIAAITCDCGMEGRCAPDEMSNYEWACPRCDRVFSMFAPAGVPWLRITEGRDRR